MVCSTPDYVSRGQSTGPRKFRAASLNVGSLKGKEAEVRTWKLRDPVNATRFSETFRMKVATKVQHYRSPSAETAWSNLKTPLLETDTEVCGFTRPHQRKRETWWWDDSVEAAIAEKRECFKTYNVLRVQGNSLEVEAAKDA